MVDVQTGNPLGSPGVIGHRSPVPRSPYGPRSPTNYGSRPNSCAGASDSGRPYSGQNFGGRIPHPPSQPIGSPDGSLGRGRPPSVRSLHERVDMSEFISPEVKSAVRRWKRFHEEKVREKFHERKDSKKQYVLAVKTEKKQLARKIPIDILALEWMNTNKVTVDARVYLLDRLLPMLILGIEKLLMEVEKKKLAEETEVNPNFNPINYLAQHLMRNNPKYSNFPEASPYIRGLREVTDELKNQVFSFEDNRLAKIKADARRKRQEQIKAETLRTQERLARSGRIRKHYQEWMLDEEGLIATEVIHSAFKNFSEVLDGLPEYMQKDTDFMVSVKPFKKAKMSVEEFVEYMRKPVNKMSPGIFNELMSHLSKCAVAYHKAAILEARNIILLDLFKQCDHASIGIIDRHRVLGLFEAFYDKSAWSFKRHIRNPRKWPVVELDEVGDDESTISEEGFKSSSRMSVSSSAGRPESQAHIIDRPSSVPMEIRDAIEEMGVKAEAEDQPEKSAVETVKEEALGDGDELAVTAPAADSMPPPEDAEGKAEAVAMAKVTKYDEGEQMVTEETKEDGEEKASSKESEKTIKDESGEHELSEEESIEKEIDDGNETTYKQKTADKEAEKPSDEKESNETPTVTSNKAHTVTSKEAPTVTSNEAPTVTPNEASTVTSNEAPTVTSMKAHTVTSNAANTVISNEALAVTSNEAPTVTSNEAHRVTSNEAPSVISNDAPTVTSNEVPTVTSIEAPTVIPNETPTVTSKKAHTVTSGEAPTVTSNEAPTVTSNEAPTVTPNEAPTLISNEAPTVTSNDAHRVTTKEAHTVTSNETPTVTSNETPTVTSNETPTVTSNETPTVTSNEAPTFTSNEKLEVKAEQGSKPDHTEETSADGGTLAETAPEADETQNVVKIGKCLDVVVGFKEASESKVKNEPKESKPKEDESKKESGSKEDEPKEESGSKESESKSRESKEESELKGKIESKEDVSKENKSKVECGSKEESESKDDCKLKDKSESKEESELRDESQSKERNYSMVESDSKEISESCKYREYEVVEVKETSDETKQYAEESHKDGEAQESESVETMQDAKADMPKEEDVKFGNVRTKDEASEKEKTTVKDEDRIKESLPQTAASGTATAVSFNEDAIATQASKQGLKSPVKAPSTTRSGSVATSAFDQNTLNSSQFVQLIEVFLGEDCAEELVQAVIKFIQQGYVETEEERFNRLQKARKEDQLIKRKIMMDQLFDKWDNDGSGYLDLDELHSVMSKFKENMEKKIVAKAKQMLDKEDHDHRLTKTEFKQYLEVVCSLLPGGEDNFDPLVEFLMTSVERSYEERIRGQARKKWLAQIQQAAETSGASMVPVYKTVFNSLYKDSEQHGRGKRISANVAMMERNDTAPNRGPTALRYVASTPDDAHFMINRILYRDMKGISFTSVESGKPIHVPRVQNHGNIMFWNPERSDEDRHGSFIVIPLKDHRKRVFGTMGIDTLNDPQEKSIFITHEIGFFQGVAKAFSTAFQYVDIRRKTLRIAESAMAWIHRRSPHVQEINVYIVEPDDKDVSAFRQRQTSTKNRKLAKYIADETETAKLEDFILRRMMTTDKAGNIEVHDHPTKLERKENLFRDYLFKCIDNSETVTADAYGQRHIAFPLRDIDGHAVAIVDISIGELKQLPSHENKEVQRMLKLLQYAHKEVAAESEGKKTQRVMLEAEKNSEESRIDIMFDRIMLTDLRETVGKLNLRAFAELKSYKEPPKVIHDILVSVLSLFYKEQSERGELEEYHNCKQYVNPELIKRIEEFDPTALEAVGAVNRIAARLKEVPHGAVAKHGSLPAQHLYNWAFVCLSLLEHTSKVQQNRKQPTTDTPPPDSAMSGGVTEQ